MDFTANSFAAIPKSEETSRKYRLRYFPSLEFCTTCFISFLDLFVGKSQFRAASIKLAITTNPIAATYSHPQFGSVAVIFKDATVAIDPAIILKACVILHSPS